MNNTNIEEMIKCQLNNMRKLIKQDQIEYVYNPEIGCIEILTKLLKDNDNIEV